MTSGRRRGAWYWVVAGVLVVFGFITGFSIGLPFLLLGYVLFALGPVRDKRWVFWPVCAGVIALELGYILVGPFRCTTSQTATTSSQGVTTTRSGSTSCSALIGLKYHGGPDYNPPLWPAVTVGLGAGAAAAAGAWVLTWRQRASPRSPG